MNVKNEVSVSKVRKDAEDYYRNGYFCCEAVMASVRDNFELDVPKEVIADVYKRQRRAISDP